MPSWPDHALAVVLAVFFPLRAATFGYRRLLNAPPERVVEVRRSLYLQAIALQWILAGIAIGLWIRGGRQWVALGLEPRGALGLALGMTLAAAFGLASWAVRARVRRSPEALDHYVEKLRHLERMLPRTRRELNLFYGVSVTAGICEELLYRGYLLWYLGHWLGIGPAIGLASAIFGLGHAYQGWKGIATTGVVGLLFAGIYLASGSLWPAMALHALTDAHAGALSHAALTRGASVVEPGSGTAAEPPRQTP